MALFEMRNVDAQIEANAIAEGKHGSYNPWFIDEIRQLQTIIANAERPNKQIESK